MPVRRDGQRKAADGNAVCCPEKLSLREIGLAVGASEALFLRAPRSKCARGTLPGPWLALPNAGRADLFRPWAEEPSPDRHRRGSRDIGMSYMRSVPRAHRPPPGRQREIQQRCAPPATTVVRSRTQLSLLAVTRPCRNSP